MARRRSGISSNGTVVSAGAMTRRRAPPTRHTLRASTMKDLIDLIFSNLHSQQENIVSQWVSSNQRLTITVTAHFEVYIF